MCSLSGWADTQLVQNGGFETGAPDPWTVVNECIGSPCTPWTVVAGGAEEGSYSLEDQGGYEVYQALTPTATILLSQASFWFKTDPGVLFWVDLSYLDGSSAIVYESAADSNWDQYDLLNELQAGSGSGKFLTQIDFGTGSRIDGSPNDTGWLDNVSIEAKGTLNPPVPDPDSLLLFGCGTVALGSIRTMRSTSRSRR